MPFFGPLTLSQPLAAGDIRIQQFAEQLRRAIPGLTGLTTYPAAYGGGASAFGFSADYNPFQGAVPTTLDQALQTVQPITNPSFGIIPESLTGVLARGVPGRSEVPSEQARCFPASMRVLMADGSTPSIREVRVGQALTAWSWTDHLLIADRVLHVHAHEGAEDLRRLNALRVTGWHRLCVGADLWKRAHDVSESDGVWGLDPRTAQGVIHTICSVADGLPSEPVWTLTVQRAENFFIVAPDDTVWLVHNDGGDGGGGGGGGGAADIGLGMSGEATSAGAAADTSAGPAGASAAGEGGISAAEAAAIGGPPGSPTGSAPGMGGGGTTSAAGAGEGTGLAPATVAMLNNPKASLLDVFRAADPTSVALVKTGIDPTFGFFSPSSLAGRVAGNVIGQIAGGPVGGTVGGQIGGFLGGKAGIASDVSTAANIAGFSFGGFGPSTGSGASTAPSLGGTPSAPGGQPSGVGGIK